MKFDRIRWIAGAAVVALTLAACGGGDDDNPPLVTFGRMVSFGTSVSDSGTYKTPVLAAAYGGGKFTINGPGGSVWVERIAQELNLPALCPAQTGLEASGPFAALAAPVTNVAGCTNYAQGGARVTNPVGPWNKALLNRTPVDPRGYRGDLTKPVVEQIQRHLAANGGAFAANDLVTVEAIGNDLFENVLAVRAAVAAGGNATAAGQAAVNAMGLAGGELAAYIKALIVGKGAKQVVVLSHADISKTPDAASLDQATRDLIEMMSFTFNAFLTEGLKGVPEVLVVDGYGLIRDQAANPSKYGFDDYSTLACPVVPAAGVVLALFCSSTALAPGVNPDRVAWADGSHPTPKGHQTIADAALVAMRTRGWAP